MKDEAEVQSDIQIAAMNYGCVLMRNNSGCLNDITGRPVRYGLGHVSKKQNEKIKSSDLIGITPLTITPAMVGMTLGIFTASEVKKEIWNPNKKFDKTENAQDAFIKFILSKGGFAGFANSVDSFVNILKK